MNFTVIVKGFFLRKKSKFQKLILPQRTWRGKAAKFKNQISKYKIPNKNSKIKKTRNNKSHE